MAALEATQATLSENQLTRLQLIKQLRKASQKTSQLITPATALPDKKISSQDCQAQGDPKA